MWWVGETRDADAVVSGDGGDGGYELFAAHSPSLRRTSCQTFLDSGRALLVAVLAGVVVGSVVATLELNPSYNYHTWLYMSFPTGSLGIWAVACVVIADHSVSGGQAALRTFGFLAAVVLMYFCVRYVNFVDQNARIVASMSEVMDGRYTVMRQTSFWGPEKWAALFLGLMLAGVGAVAAWGIRRYASSPAYWVFAWIPLFVLVFEGWSYFVPMVVYVQIGFVPAVVDVVGAAAVAWILVCDRNRALAERIA